MILDNKYVKLLKSLPVKDSNYHWSDFPIKYQTDDSSGSLTITAQVPFTGILCKELEQNGQQAFDNNQLLARLVIDSQLPCGKVSSGVAPIEGIKNIIAVASGKGGVGKSSVTSQLACATARLGAKVGVLDADLYGPSLPLMFGVEGQKPEQIDKHFVPLKSPSGVEVISFGSLIKETQAVAWRGPMVTQALQQLFFQTKWDNLDYLFIDMPPGTGDIHLTLAHKIPVTGAVIVTTPQDIALLDARKGIDFFKKVKTPILGIIENMSLHICSQCGHTEAIFGENGGKNLATETKTPLLAQLPLDMAIRTAMDNGNIADLLTQRTDLANLFEHASREIMLRVAMSGKDYRHLFGAISVQNSH